MNLKEKTLQITYYGKRDLIDRFGDQEGGCAFVSAFNAYKYFFPEDGDDDTQAEYWKYVRKRYECTLGEKLGVPTRGGLKAYYEILKELNLTIKKVIAGKNNYGELFGIGAQDLDLKVQLIEESAEVNFTYPVVLLMGIPDEPDNSDSEYGNRDFHFFFYDGRDKSKAEMRYLEEVRKFDTLSLFQIDKITEQ